MSKDMKNDIERVFFTEEEIEAKVKELGEQISKDFEGKDPLFAVFALIVRLEYFVVFLVKLSCRIIRHIGYGNCAVILPA